MDQIFALDLIEAMGWLAAVLTVATYAVRTMMALRILALVSSLVFVGYAAVLQLWPLVGMELILIPINVYRLWQIVSLRGRLSRAVGGEMADFSIIETYGTARQCKAGSVIFQRGDPVDSLYYIGAGKIMIEDVGIEVTAGDIFGEIAFFTDGGTRTATARCIEDAQVYELDEKHFMRLQFEDPSFGLSVMRTVARRLMYNASLPEKTAGVPS